jgi:protocatechuate 3,4-dioxygenase alpha subunit
MSLQQTTSQTVGPYFAIGLTWLNRSNLTGPDIAGQKVAIEGNILDGDQRPVPDALIEIWQADAHGKYGHPEDAQDKPLDAAFHGYGRIPADRNGHFRFTTVKPGQVPGPDGKYQAPHINVSIFARGLLRRLVTRIYFADDPANEADFVLNLVPARRRDTLLATPDPSESGLFQFHVHLSGERETVFFDV